MTDLTSYMTRLVDQLEPIARPGGKGRVLMFLGGSKRAGTSTLARSFAKAAADRSERGVWLFDLDFARNGQASILGQAGARAFDAGFGREPFWRAEPAEAQARLVAKQCGEHLYVTQFQRAKSSINRLSFQASSAYWNAVRGAIDLAIVDAPGSSRAVLPIVGDMDGVMLVVDESHWSEQAIAARRQAIEERGGVVAGLIANRSRGESRNAA